MLNKQFKRKWLRALRKGDYNQTKRHLRVTESQAATASSDRHDLPVGYCCLGVACEVTRELNTDITVDRALEREDMPTKTQMLFWGLDEVEASTLAEMNDQGFSFNEIADYIERSL